MTDPIDARLAAFLAVPERAPDEAFTQRVRQAVLLEERLRAARRRSRRRLLSESIASLAVLLAFLVLGTWRPPNGEVVPLVGPAMTAVLLLALWSVFGLRPDRRG